MNDQSVTSNDLKIVVTPHLRQSLVFVRADKIMGHEKFVEIVGEMHALGFRRMSLKAVTS